MLQLSINFIYLLNMMWIILGGLLAIAAMVMAFYNGAVQLRIKVEEAWADIDTFLKQRFDMIPNLVEMVKGYMKHEQETLENITKYRSAVAGASSMDEMAEADNALSGTLKTLFAVAENYPDLKANQNFMKLQEDLKVLEDSLQKSRRYYNGTVRDYNTKIQMFPGSLFAGIFGFLKKEFFKVVGEARENVKVSFDD
jgi:LemA protein